MDQLLRVRHPLPRRGRGRLARRSRRKSPQQLREQHRIDVRLHHEVVGIDLTAGQVEVRDQLRQRTITMGFDRLHIATGAQPLRPDIPGIDDDHVFGVQTLEDAKLLLERARLAGSKQVVVVGGGYIGLEMAEAFVRHGASVTLVEAGEQVMSTLDRGRRRPARPSLRGLGVDVRLNEKVEAIEPGQVVTARAPCPADLVVLGMGVRPNTDLAADAGIELGPSGAIAVNRRQQTSAEGVYSAGDCAETFHLVAGHPVHIALGTVANKAGRVAGINIGGGYATFPGVVGTAITKVCEWRCRTGLSEHEAISEGFKPVAASVDTTARAGYLPEPGTMTVKLVAESGTGRLLGGQILGEGEHVGQAAKRIDTVAMALHGGMGVADLVDADLAYAPFSSVWDPVQQAARKLASRF